MDETSLIGIKGRQVEFDRDQQYEGRQVYFSLLTMTIEKSFIGLFCNDIGRKASADRALSFFGRRI